MSRQVKTLPKKEPSYLYRRYGDSDFDRKFSQGRIEEYRAWAQFHKEPWVGNVVAPGSVIQFRKRPVFRGLIRVEPPLGPDNLISLTRLGVMENCHLKRWNMCKVAEKLGMETEQAVAQYGPEGQFFDVNSTPIDWADETLVEFPGQNVPPSSQPNGTFPFHYWEEDADTGRVVRCAGQRNEEETLASESEPTNTVAYLAWNGGMKCWYPVEWLAYLGEAFFKPVGCKLNGEIEWWDCEVESIGRIRVVDSFVSVPESCDIYGGSDEVDCFDCPVCEKAYDGGGPPDYIIPLLEASLFVADGRDAKRVAQEQTLFESLPKPCTWQTAAYKHFLCRVDFNPVATSSLLLALPASPPVKGSVCPNAYEEEGDGQM